MQPQQTQSFNKTEKLCNDKLIQRLFFRGRSFFVYPFKVIWVYVDDNDRFEGKYPAKVLLTVSKKRFKHAVKRNRIKRLMREAYRKNKYFLYDKLSSNNRKIALAFVYTAKDILDYHETKKKINLSIQRLCQEIDKL